MSMLGAIAVDFAEQLKKRAKGWCVTPLVASELNGIYHNSFLYVKRIPPNQSPLSFYVANPPIEDCAYLQIKQQGRALRLISLELRVGVNYTAHLSFWRANGYSQAIGAIDVRRFKHSSSKNEQVLDGYDALKIFSIHHTSKSNKGRVYHKHSFDLSIPEPPIQLIELVIRIINKSYNWIGRGRKETFSRYQFPVMVDLDGKNHQVSEHQVK